MNFHRACEKAKFAGKTGQTYSESGFRPGTGVFNWVFAGSESHLLRSKDAF